MENLITRPLPPIETPPKLFANWLVNFTEADYKKRSKGDNCLNWSAADYDSDTTLHLRPPARILEPKYLNQNLPPGKPSTQNTIAIMPLQYHIATEEGKIKITTFPPAAEQRRVIPYDSGPLNSDWGIAFDIMPLTPKRIEVTAYAIKAFEGALESLLLKIGEKWSSQENKEALKKQREALKKQLAKTFPSPGTQRKTRDLILEM